MGPLCQVFYVASGDLKSDPHAFKVSALSTEPSPQPSKLPFKDDCEHVLFSEIFVSFLRLFEMPCLRQFLEFSRESM